MMDLAILKRHSDMIGASAGALLAFLVVSMSGLLVPLMALDLGATPARIGVLLSVSAVGSLAAAIPAGLLVNRFGTRFMIVASSLVTGAGCLYAYLFPTLGSLFVALSVFGIGWTMFAVAVQCHIGAIGGEGRSSSNFGWYGSAVAVGQMIGPLLSGVLIDAFGKRVVWLVMAVLVSMTGAGLRFVIRPGLAVGPTPDHSDGRPDGRAVARQPGIRDFFGLATVVGVLSSFVIIFALGARTSFFPILLRNAGYSASLMGAVEFVRGLASVFARASIGAALKAVRGRFNLLMTCQLVLAAGLATIPLSLPAPLLVLNALIIGVGFGVATPLSQAIVFDSVTAERRGMAMGIRMTGNRVAQMASPLLFGLLIQGSDPSSSFVASGVVLVLMTSPMLWWWARSRRASGMAPAL